MENLMTKSLFLRIQMAMEKLINNLFLLINCIYLLVLSLPRKVFIYHRGRI
ncbi:Uncharacterised protein [Mycobacterium tuberculosis]|nr:Uncharacterised protein [Mycobacterium tuberculosis]